MAMSFSSTTNRTTTRKRSRNIFGLPLSSETRGVLHALFTLLTPIWQTRRYKKARTHNESALCDCSWRWIVTEDWVSRTRARRWLPEEDYEVTIFANKYSREHPEFRQLFKATKFFVAQKSSHHAKCFSLSSKSLVARFATRSRSRHCICGDASLLKRAQRMGIRQSRRSMNDILESFMLISDVVQSVGI
ncbi:hypothetical protein Plhal703r1_c77g0173231 [Plasmopara halstedii]